MFLVGLIKLFLYGLYSVSKDTRFNKDFIKSNGPDNSLEIVIFSIRPPIELNFNTLNAWLQCVFCKQKNNLSNDCSVLEPFLCIGSSASTLFFNPRSAK